MGEWVRVEMYRRKRTCKEDRREGKGEKSERVVIGEDRVCVCVARTVRCWCNGEKNIWVETR